MATDESLASLLDPTAQQELDAFIAACEDDSLPTPSQADVLADLIEWMWRKLSRRAYQLADHPDFVALDSIDPAYAAKQVSEPPEPMSAQCDTADWTLLDSLPDSAHSRLAAFYAYRYEGKQVLFAPTELVSELCHRFLDEMQAARRQRRTRHLVETCPAGEAVHACLGFDGEAHLLSTLIDRHTFPAEASEAEMEDVSWTLTSKDLAATREHHRQRIRYTTAAFQVYAEIAVELHSREIPEIAHVEFEASDRPDGYLLPFYVPQRDGLDWVHGYEPTLRFVTAYAEELVPEQFEAASAAYDDVASGRAHLVLVADTERLAVGAELSAGGKGDQPPWLVNALARVRDHPYDDGHGGRDGPFEEGRDWNPFAKPT
ncbi:hypothetical protein [Haloglomus halophilum]|uniref:hypothetical protein n=1 Tax=Haloglomus halophilum TaxID=2962672 RepID=UPI0020C9BF34|nr:hypothetical protein [Haloglomus halophilum]